MSSPLFTPRFLIMFGYSFTVFVSLFQLLPAAPYRVLDMGGSTFAAGLFLGCLTFSSALSAPFTGPLCDRLGHRPVLIVVSLILTALTASYAVISDYHVLLAVVVVHGTIWSALLSASGAYMTATIPPSRRAEGLSYWGLSSVLSIGVAPALGFWVYRHGWTTLCMEMAALNLTMAIIAWFLPDDRPEHEAHHHPPAAGMSQPLESGVEWRVLILTVGLSLISFGYGGITSFSALFADDLGIAPRSLFLTVMAGTIMLGRLTIGRTLDRIGHRKVLLRCLVIPPVGMLLLAFSTNRTIFILAAAVFGAGFGLMHPSFTAYVMSHVRPNRRGAAFGAILAAFDTGIGLGSSVLGWVIHASSYRVAFVGAAALALLSVPYFLVAEKRLGYRQVTPGDGR
jgi:MFS family permease